MRRRTFIAASLGTVAGAIGCGASSAIARRGDVHVGTALAFGTTVSVSVVQHAARHAELAIEDALHAVLQVDRLMSVHSADSQVFQLNRDGTLAKPHPHLLRVLRQARELSVLTKGAFDITVQPLWHAFRRAADGGRLPSDEERAQLRPRAGWSRVRASSEQVSLLRPASAITLNGLARGYAADLALEALRESGIEHALVDTGAFAAHGHQAGAQGWVLGIPDPREADANAASLRLDGRCVATSGDYQAAFTPDFAHHHIFDPRTGDSPRELASVTVVAASGILADGLSTAFMVMGSRKAHALAARLPGVDLMSINKRGVVWKSPGFPVGA